VLLATEESNVDNLGVVEVTAVDYVSTKFALLYASNSLIKVNTSRTIEGRSLPTALAPYA
jgi:hypothetical protein